MAPKAIIKAASGRDYSGGGAEYNVTLVVKRTFRMQGRKQERGARLEAESQVRGNNAVTGAACAGVTVWG